MRKTSVSNHKGCTVAESASPRQKKRVKTQKHKAKQEKKFCATERTEGKCKWFADTQKLIVSAK